MGSCNVEPLDPMCWAPTEERIYNVWRQEHWGSEDAAIQEAGAQGEGWVLGVAWQAGFKLLPLPLMASCQIPNSRQKGPHLLFAALLKVSAGVFVGELIRARDWVKASLRGRG